MLMILDHHQIDGCLFVMDIPSVKNKKIVLFFSYLVLN